MKAWSSERDSTPKRMISVWLINDGPYIKKFFRCCGCGLPILEYYSDVDIIFLGGEPPFPISPNRVYSHPVVVQCKRCKQMYRVE